MRAFLLAAALVVALFAAGSVQAQAADEIMDLKLQIVELQNAGTLAVSGFSFCQKIMNYASYVPLRDKTVEQGGTLYVYYEPAYWFTNTAQGRYEMWLTQDIRLTTSDGQELFFREKLLNLQYNTAKPVLDVYLTNEFSLGKLPPGEYVYEVTLHDELSGQEARHQEAFSIR